MQDDSSQKIQEQINKKMPKVMESGDMGRNAGAGPAAVRTGTPVAQAGASTVTLNVSADIILSPAR